MQRLAMERLGERAGAVVVLRPQDGAVRVLASTPSFDPNRVDANMFLRADPRARLLNRATAGLYPPGSTFKVVIAADAWIGFSGRIDCPADGWTTSGRYRKIRDHEYYEARRAGRTWRGHGRIGLSTALSESSNVFFAQLGVYLGHDAFAETTPASCSTAASPSAPATPAAVHAHRAHPTHPELGPLRPGAGVHRPGQGAGDAGADGPGRGGRRQRRRRRAAAAGRREQPAAAGRFMQSGTASKLRSMMRRAVNRGHRPRHRDPRARHRRQDRYRGEPLRSVAQLVHRLRAGGSPGARRRGAGGARRLRLHRRRAHRARSAAAGQGAGAPAMSLP
jgi:peptidoglycan glycosyltransferase